MRVCVCVQVDGSAVCVNVYVCVCVQVDGSAVCECVCV